MAQVPLTIPELLLILKVVRHFKCHTVFADQLPKSSSPATQVLGVIVRGAKQVVMFSCSHETLRRTAAVSASLFLIGQARLELNACLPTLLTSLTPQPPESLTHLARCYDELSDVPESSLGSGSGSGFPCRTIRNRAISVVARLQIRTVRDSTCSSRVGYCDCGPFGGE